MQSGMRLATTEYFAVFFQNASCTRSTLSECAVPLISYVARVSEQAVKPSDSSMQTDVTAFRADIAKTSRRIRFCISANDTPGEELAGT